MRKQKYELNGVGLVNSVGFVLAVQKARIQVSPTPKNITVYNLTCTLIH